MALKRVYDAETDIPDGFASLYSEANGKWVLTGIEGLVTQDDVGKIKKALDSERTLHKEAKKKLEAYGDYTPEKLAELQQEAEELRIKASGKVDDTKIAELVNTKLAQVRGPLDRKIQDTVAQLSEKDKVIAELQNERKSGKIVSAVTSAALKAKVITTAMYDVELLAERVFEVTDDNKVITKDGVGCVPGQDPAAWLAEMQASRPHWWAASQGGGARGTGGLPGYENNPWSKEYWNVTKQAQIVRDLGEAKALQIAQRAGVDLNATRPKA